MSENELLKTLVRKSSSLPEGTVDITAGVMRSIHQKLSESDIQEIEQESFNTFYWASGISIAVALLFSIGLNMYFNFYSDYSFDILNILASN